MKTYKLLLNVLCVAHIFSACTPSESEKKPNVVLILTDDQGYGDVAFNGNKFIETPTIDKMAEDNIVFDNFYVSTVCAPTRASLLSGKYHLRTGTHGVSSGKENMSPDVETMAEIFKENGYKTGAFGKWHNGTHYPFHPNRQGFDQFVGFCMGHWNNYFNSTIEENGEPILAEGFLPDYLTKRAINFIEENSNEPFFCYIPYNTPHSPFQVPDQYFEKYKQKGLDDKAASIYGMVENIDDNINHILKTLETLNIDDNTIVIYLSDNGPVPGRYNANMLGTKGQVDEGGIRVPCILQMPKQLCEINSQTITHPVAHIDLLPTLVDLLHLNVGGNADFDGLSLRPLIENISDEQLNERLIYTKASHNTLDYWNASVRSKDYRLVIQRHDTLLYNITEDPCQQQNIYAQEPELALELLADYTEWYWKVMAEMPKYTSIPIGYPEQKSIQMPAHEAVKTDGVQFKEGHGWANDWLLNFSAENDSIYWEIDVKKSGIYGFELLYDASKVSDGAELVISTQSNHKIIPMETFFEGQMVDSPDRVVRKEVYEKTWGKLQLGDLFMDTQDKYISLKVKGNILNDLQVKAINLKKK